LNQRLEPITLDRIDGDAAKVVRRLSRHGHQSYLVGGCVRDMLLGRSPKDFDVATSATPNEIKQLFRNCRIIGRRFRLAHILFSRKVIETATFRAPPAEDAAEADGDPLIWHDNEFGTAEEDARRRDFTINGLFYDVGSGKVIDWVDGMADLRARCVRTIGDPDVRMQEDPVRILRAVKFAARLGLEIDPATRDACVRHAALIARCSVARVLEEIYKLLREGSAGEAFRMLYRLQILGVLFPEVAALAPPELQRELPAVRAGRRRHPGGGLDDTPEDADADVDDTESDVPEDAHDIESDVPDDAAADVDDTESDVLEDADADVDDTESDVSDDADADDADADDDDADDADADDADADDAGADDAGADDADADDAGADDADADDADADDADADDADDADADDADDADADDADADDADADDASRAEHAPIDEHYRAEQLLADLDLSTQAQRDSALELLWGTLGALDELVGSLEEPSQPLLLAALLAPLTSEVLRDDRRLAQSAEQVDRLVRTVSLRLQVSRRHRERLKQIVIAQRRLAQNRPRQAIAQRDYFPQALQLLRMRHSITEEFGDAIERWEKLLTRGGGRPAQREGRRRRRGGRRTRERSAKGEGGGQGQDPGSQGES